MYEVGVRLIGLSDFGQTHDAGQKVQSGRQPTENEAEYSKCTESKKESNDEKPGRSKRMSIAAEIINNCMADKNIPIYHVSILSKAVRSTLLSF